MPLGAWGTIRLSSSYLFIFLHQKILITLQKIQVSSILSQAIVIGLTISQLLHLQSTPPITRTYVLQTVDFWHINMADLSQVINYGHEKIFAVILNQLMSCRFALFVNFTPLYISIIYGAFFNKAFQDCSLKNYIWSSGHALTIEYTYFWLLYLINT